MAIKMWVDDIRPAPDGYEWFKSVNEVFEFLSMEFDFCIMMREQLEILLDLDHDAGEYANQGGDYIEILNAIERNNHFRKEHNNPEIYEIIPTIHIHSMNPVGVENMRRVIQRNGWKEI